MYVDRKRSTNNQVIYNNTDEDCDILTVKSRPHWLPREFTSTISVSCSAQFTGTSRKKSAADGTIKQISSHNKKMELEHPNSCILVMGDFNQLPIKLTGYYRTGGNKTLDKCFTWIKYSFNSCHQLAQIGNFDQFVMHLIPSCEPRYKSKPTIITRRIYKDNHSKDLRACFETNLWDNMLTSDDDINTKTDIITGYINFCTALCIPTKKVKKYANKKP